ncbi:MAG TPA: CIA30 family protein [Rubrivivax sp.]|nr:CIA30 family protein [Rubrivivax sp.]
MPTVLFDFADPRVANAWRAIDDRVMGGVSRSTLRSDPGGHAVFEGEVSLDSNGGFASVRSAPAAHGRTGAQTCVLEVQGEAKRFKLNFLTEDSFEGLNYQAAFTPDPDRWQRLRIPLAEFRPSFRGREVPGAPPLDPARLRQVGLMIAERQAGPFALAIRRISLA